MRTNLFVLGLSKTNYLFLIKILVIYFGSIYPIDSFSQIRVDQSNNVGIGLATPSKKFEVLGESKFTGNSQFLGIFNLQRSASNTSIYIGTDIGGTSTAGNQNIIIGNDVGNPSSIESILIGHFAGKNVRGSAYNIFMGSNSGFNHNKSNNVSNGHNVYIGYQVGRYDSVGMKNCYIGYQAGYNNKGYSTGVESFNTCLGSSAGYINTLGRKNTLLGASSDYSSNNLTNVSSLGYAAIATTSNSVKIGNSSIVSIGGAVGWSIPSDVRFKDNITDDVPGLSFITLLQPKSYNFNTQKYTQHLVQLMPDSIKSGYLDDEFSASSSIRRVGFLAQDVDQVCSTIGFDFDGITKPIPGNLTSHYSISYASFVVPLVKAVQEQQILITSLQQSNINLTNQINDLLNRVRELERKVP